MPDEQKKTFVAENLKTNRERILQIERNITEQSDCDVCYSERSKTLQLISKTFDEGFPDFVLKFTSSLRSSKVHIEILKPVCK